MLLVAVTAVTSTSTVASLKQYSPKIVLNYRADLFVYTQPLAVTDPCLCYSILEGFLLLKLKTVAHFL